MSCDSEIGYTCVNAYTYNTCMYRECLYVENRDDVRRWLLPVTKAYFEGIRRHVHPTKYLSRACVTIAKKKSMTPPPSTRTLCLPIRDGVWENRCCSNRHCRLATKHMEPSAIGILSCCGNKTKFKNNND